MQVDAAASLLDATRQAGVELISLCGGMGICDSCKIRLRSGTLSKLTIEELAVFTPEELADGFRLACQAYPQGDLVIEVPRESLTALQRLQVEGQTSSVMLSPSIGWVDVEVTAPDLTDLRADTARILQAARTEAWGNLAESPVTFSLPVLKVLSENIRTQGWFGRLVRHGNDMIAILPTGTRILGLAVDIGTTKLATYLLDMESGETLGSTGEMNPQISYGEDVLSRISFANQHADGRAILQHRVMEILDKMAQELASQIGASTAQILDAVLVGNTAMHHLAVGLPVRQLGESPYVAAASESISVPASEIGLGIAPSARVYLPPNLAGFIGADHVAMLLASEAPQKAMSGEVGFPVIALDIGTNTEISLIFCDKPTGEIRILSCSAASGPAFEGAHIASGMRAAPGAIERVQIDEQKIRIHTVGDQAPVGICGSGILDAIAQMLDNGILDRKGSFRPGHPHVHVGGQAAGRGEMILASQDITGHGHEISITRRDVHEIQLAKAAIRAGIEVLLLEAGLSADDLRDAPGVSMIIAGAFGTYLHLPSAVRIGMFPDIPLARFAQIGNAAGMGARQMLLSTESRHLAERIANRIKYIELANHAGFNRLFMQSLFFGQ